MYLKCIWHMCTFVSSGLCIVVPNIQDCWPLSFQWCVVVRNTKECTSSFYVTHLSPNRSSGVRNVLRTTQGCRPTSIISISCIRIQSSQWRVICITSLTVYIMFMSRNCPELSQVAHVLCASPRTLTIVHNIEVTSSKVNVTLVCEIFATVTVYSGLFTP